MRNGALLTAGAVVGLALGGRAMAGVELTMESSNLTNPSTRTNTLYLDTDRVKIDTGRVTIIYRGDLKKTWAIQPEKNTYMEFDPQAMAAPMQSATSQRDSAMAEAMKNMTPEQRQQVAAALAAHGSHMPAYGGSSNAGPASFEKTGETKTVGQWSCAVYKKTVNGTVESTLCITPIDQVGLKPDDFKVFTDMANSFGGMAGRQAQATPMLQFDEQTKAIGFQGFPVETVTYLDGKPSRTTTFKSLQRTSFPAGTFDLPAGLTKQDMAGMHHGPTAPE